MGLNKTETEFEVAARIVGVPEQNIEGMVNYVFHGIRPGSFLEAVFKNDLKESFACADSDNQYAMFKIVKFMYNEFPFHSQGSPERVERWIDHFQKQRLEAGKVS